MTEFKKMALLPANFLEQLQASTSVQPPPPTVRQTPAERQLSRLDTEMKRILDDGATPDEVKVKLYGHALHQFNQIHENASKPIPIELAEKPGRGGRSTELLLRHMPERKTENASALLAFLKEHPEIQWNERGEIMDKGDVIRGSNIADIFNYTVREMKHEPRGWSHFYEQLLNGNVPQLAIGNSIVRRQVTQRYAQPPAQPSPRRSPVGAPPAAPAAPAPLAATPTSSAATAAAATPPYGTPPATRRRAREFTPTQARARKPPASKKPNQTGKGRKALQREAGKKTHVMRFVGLYK